MKYEVRNLDGVDVRGALLPVAEGPITFGAKQLRHETRKFSGRRLVLVAYSLQALSHASSEDLACLKRLGFQVPQPNELPSSYVPALLKNTGSADIPVMIEVFAGSAGITRAARDAGLNAIAVDWGRNKHETKAASLHIDLSSEDGENMFFSLMQEKRPRAVHVAPPCGTASLARERPLPAPLIQQGAPSPKPLRSPEWIWGLPHLTGSNEAKVDTANRLYRFTARVMMWCLECGCLISIENPLGSYFWPCLVDCVRTMGTAACNLYNTLEHVVFSSCLHGGSRQKSTKWLSSPGVFSSLAGECPGESSTHKHLPYGVHRTTKHWHFDTASEGAYPDLLCLRVVHCIASALGFSPDPPAPRVADPIGQSRKSRRLLPEYARITKCNPFALPEVPHKVLGPSLGGGSRGLSLGTLAASTPDPNRDAPAGHDSFPDAKTPVEPQSAMIEVGIYAAPKEYLDMARNLVHPLDGDLAISDWTKQALFDLLTTHPSSIAGRRAAFLKHVLEVRLRLEPDEAALHGSMAPHIQRVMKGKRLLLFQHLLAEYEYDDMGVMDELVGGAALTGVQKVPPYADRKISASASTREILESEATWRTLATMQRSTPGEDRESLLAMGNKEVEAGFLSGPFFSAKAVTEELGRADWLANPRFILYQGAHGKPRVIDDAKSSGLNDAYTSGERLRLQDIDYVSLMCLQAGRMSSKSSVSVTLSSGRVLTGKRAVPKPSWKGRTLDLRKAYKQMAVSSDDRHLMVLTHLGPSGRVFYISDALPFGARGSVYSFLRTSRALSFLMNVGLAVPGSVFFDDFPSLSEASSTSSAFDGPHALLTALGWLYADDPEKCQPFSSCFNVLGCRLDLTDLASGSLIMSNREGRVEGIRSMVQKLRSDSGQRNLVPVIQGHLNFASSFIMGRALQPLARSLSWKMSTEDHADLCGAILDTLKKCKPRTVSWHSPAEPVLLFTDASYEGGRSGIGAVLVDTLGGKPEIFDGEIPGDVIRHWQSTGQEQIISQAELAVVVMMRHMLRTRLAGRRVIYFIDNEAARYSLLKGTSGKDSMQRLAAAFHAVDLHHPAIAWVERVPSDSNPADAPSRGKASECAKTLGGTYAGKIFMPEEVRQAIKSSLVQTASLTRLPLPCESLVLLPGLSA